ncbi:transglycosylase SLT domain-containing protein [Asticcacaulis biprosthecium]|nr:transglycosylase SLT domain-containing protein [Asticcacaulis biprosthecium]
MFGRSLSIFAVALLTATTSVTSLASTASSARLRDPEVFHAGYFPDLLDELSYDPDVRIALGRAGLETLSRQRSVRGFTAEKNLRSPGGLVALVAREGFEAGMDPRYLVRLAQRESNFDPFAGAQTSTAFGLFQFTENTWLCSLKEFGPALGVSGAEAIWRNRRGVCETSTRGERARLLALRSDASLSTKVAAAFSLKNYRVLSSEFGRRPSASELYMLHFFGQDAGLRFLEGYALRPYLPASLLVPDAAASNGRIFFTSGGRPRTVGEVFDRLRLAGLGRL